MNNLPTLDRLAGEINECLAAAEQFSSQAADKRLEAGKLLLNARHRIEAGEVEAMDFRAWCGRHIKRSARDVRRLIAIASADDPAAAREAEKQRNRDAKPAGSRAIKTPWQCHDEGVGAFLRGVAEGSCPYAARDKAKHAAWRKGWAEHRDRTGASPPPLEPAPDHKPNASALVAARGGSREDQTVGSEPPPRSVLDRLFADWAAATEAERAEFLAKVRATLVSTVQPQASEEQGDGVPGAPSGIEALSAPSEDEDGGLYAIWQGLKPNTQKWAVQWVQDDCPVKVDPHEPIPITQALTPFRAAAHEASDTQLDSFLKKSAHVGWGAAA